MCDIILYDLEILHFVQNDKRVRFFTEALGFADASCSE